MAGALYVVVMGCRMGVGVGGGAVMRVVRDGVHMRLGTPTVATRGACQLAYNACKDTTSAREVNIVVYSKSHTATGETTPLRLGQGATSHIVITATMGVGVERWHCAAPSDARGSTRRRLMVLAHGTHYANIMRVHGRCGGEATVLDGRLGCEGSKVVTTQHHLCGTLWDLKWC